MHDQDWNKVLWWSWAAPLAAAVLIAAIFWQVIAITNVFVVAGAVLLLCGAVFAAVHHAEVLAVKIGEPFGSILLALSITALEVGLIVSVMISGSAGSQAVARDTVYSVVMIVLNGIVGLCLLFGAKQHYEQTFKLQGAVGILSVIATLAIITMVLPNFTLSTQGPTYAPSQLLFIGAISLILYVLFVFVQTVLHRRDFIMEDALFEVDVPPTRLSTVIAAVLLAASLVVVIWLAKMLSPLVERAVVGVQLPLAVVGVIIAMVVLLPEGVTAIKAAMRNRLQASLNASLGSAAASIGITIPIVGVLSIYLEQPLLLGLGPESMVMLLLTLFVSTLTFATGRTTILQGAVHLVIFGVFLFLSAVP